MEMTNILDTLVQSIEKNAFPHGCANGEYRQNKYYARLHMQWLAEHLNDEERERLEKARDAESYVDTLEREALVRLALAVGIRLALSC